MKHSTPNESEHANIWELLPWYLNDTLTELDRKRVDLHLTACAACRDQMAIERRIHERVARNDTMEHIATPSLRRLQERIDDLATAATPVAQSPSPLPPRSVNRGGLRRVFPWQGLMAASVAILAAALIVTATHRAQPTLARTPPPDYYTVTTAAQRPPGEAIRAVFAPTITLEELQSILALSHLKIVAGPTEAGVYSLAPTSSLPVTSSLTLLRRQHSVRFAEKTPPDLDGNTP
jgi:anti-sigma factor RsiW